MSGRFGRRALASDSALRSVVDNRIKFDALLDEYSRTKTMSELKNIYKEFTGYESYARSKAELIKAIRNWQREEELRDDLSKAQAKHAP